MAFAAMNVAGGYLVTDRMLQMFRTRPVLAKRGADNGHGEKGESA